MVRASDGRRGRGCGMDGQVAESAQAGNRVVGDRQPLSHTRYAYGNSGSKPNPLPHSLPRPALRAAVLFMHFWGKQAGESSCVPSIGQAIWGVRSKHVCISKRLSSGTEHACCRHESRNFRPNPASLQLCASRRPDDLLQDCRHLLSEEMWVRHGNLGSSG